MSIGEGEEGEMRMEERGWGLSKRKGERTYKELDEAHLVILAVNHELHRKKTSSVGSK